MKRMSKELKISFDNEFNAKIGTVNKNSPNVFYIKGKCRLKPLYNESYKGVIDDMKRSINREIIKMISDTSLLDRRFIFDFSPSSDIMECGKSKYTEFSVFFKQRGCVSLDELNIMLKDSINSLLISISSILTNNGLLIV